jgi:hypothetical protein
LTTANEELGVAAVNASDRCRFCARRIFQRFHLLTLSPQRGQSGCQGPIFVRVVDLAGWDADG